MSTATATRTTVRNMATGETREYPLPPVFAAIAAYCDQHGIRAERFDMELLDVTGLPGGNENGGPRVYFTAGDWCARQDA